MPILCLYTLFPSLEYELTTTEGGEGVFWDLGFAKKKGIFQKSYWDLGSINPSGTSGMWD